MIPLTIPEIKRLLAALTTQPLPRWLVIHWDAWTRRHQARSRRFHNAPGSPATPNLPWSASENAADLLGAGIGAHATPKRLLESPRLPGLRVELAPRPQVKPGCGQPAMAKDQPSLLHGPRIAGLSPRS